MKNLPVISLVINGVLAVAVGVLFYFHFRQGGSITTADPSAPRQIVYVNVDSVNSQLDYFKERSEELNTKLMAAEKDFQGRQMQLQYDAENYKKNERNLSIDQRIVSEKSLKQREEELAAYYQQSVGELQGMQQKANAEIMEYLTKELKVQAERNKFEFVVAYAPGSPVLYANPRYDITKSVVEELNKKYKSEGKKP